MASGVNPLLALCLPGTTSSSTCSLLELSLCRLAIPGWHQLCRYLRSCPQWPCCGAAVQGETVGLGNWYLSVWCFIITHCRVCVLCPSLACQTCELSKTWFSLLVLSYSYYSLPSLEKNSQTIGDRELDSLLPILHSCNPTIHGIVFVASFFGRCCDVPVILSNVWRFAGIIIAQQHVRIVSSRKKQ